MPFHPGWQLHWNGRLQLPLRQPGRQTHLEQSAPIQPTSQVQQLGLVQLPYVESIP
jgi:hypothetical protein